jgi:hypothetical protein
MKGVPRRGSKLPTNTNGRFMEESFCERQISTRPRNGCVGGLTGNQIKVGAVPRSIRTALFFLFLGLCIDHRLRQSRKRLVGSLFLFERF